MKDNKWKENILEDALAKEAVLEKKKTNPNTRKGNVRLIWFHTVRILFSDPQFCIKTLDLAEQPL